MISATTIARSRAPSALFVCALLSAIAIGISWFIGKDLNWDLLNYHYYNGWALLHGRMGLDIAAAQLQTYFNPTLDVPLYLAIRNLSPVTVGCVYALVQSINAWLIWIIARRVLPIVSETRREWAAFGLALMVFTGVIFRAEIGGGMGDTLVSIPLLAAIAILVAKPEMPSARALLFAGFLAGFACALKLVAAIYVLGFGLASATLGVRRQRSTFPILFGLAAFVAWAVFDGWWRARLWQNFANPFFPLFNQWFQSPLSTSESLSDTRFLPHVWWQAIVYPLYWLAHPRAVSDVGRFLDLRLPVLFVVAWIWLIQRARKRAANNLSPRVAFVLLGCAFSYVAWLFVFGVFRYLGLLEMLAPLAIVLLLADLRIFRHHGFAMAAVLLAVIALVTSPLKSARGTWNDANYFGLDLPTQVAQTKAGTVLIGGIAPVAFIIPALPETLRFVRVSSNFHGQRIEFGLDREIDSLIAADAGDLYALIEPRELVAFDAHLARLHLSRPPNDQCAHIATAAAHTTHEPLLSENLLWCPLRRD